MSGMAVMDRTCGNHGSCATFKGVRYGYQAKFATEGCLYYVQRLEGLVRSIGSACLYKVLARGDCDVEHNNEAEGLGTSNKGE